MTKAPSAVEIVGGTPYDVQLFSSEEVDSLDVFLRGGKPYLKCLASGKPRPAKPEEIVRQLYVRVLNERYGYPMDRISVEKPVYFGSAVHQKSADIVISDRDDPTAAYIIVEVKRPKRRDGEEQLKSYCNAEGSPIGVWTNGGEEVILHRNDPNIYQSLSRLPRSVETLADVVGIQWTYEDLVRENKLVKESTTLKEIILSMEDLVLANAGVDAFEEVFKLIYSKLFDEWQGARKPREQLEFRVSGSTPSESYARINSLFSRAKDRWPGVFLDGDKIDLNPAHLVTCVSFLQDVKLFNSNLQVIDEAFEYLSLEVGKGKKGQYFTPRHVIDMAVKMLGPREDEYVIDPAAGSCGFTVHSIFHVWGDEFLAAGPEPWQAEYARERVYALDFDTRSIKIAKALNLIAGDGRTNVHRANSLDPRHWAEEVRVGLRPRLANLKNLDERTWNEENFKYFDFDVLLTNPPFAGEVTDSRILHQYSVAQKENGKWHTGRDRDVLFLERCLDMVRPGGRLALVLPQGRFNNSSEQPLREWLAHRARILAVVGLNVNTFKPHTGTKTSVLLLQKWNDDPTRGPLCPQVEDYSIFFATSLHSGKDNRGNYDYLRRDSKKYAVDLFDHPLIDHDLFDQRATLDQQLRRRLALAVDAEEQETIEAKFRLASSALPERATITEAFRSFAVEQGFSFAGEA